MESEPIAIVGMSCRFPEASSHREFWNNLLDAKDCITHYNELSFEETITSRGILDNISKFDYRYFGISAKDAAVMDPQHRIFLEECLMALEDAAYNLQTQSKNIGVFASMNDSDYLHKNLLLNHTFSKNHFPYRTKIMTNPGFLATRVSYYLNLTGPSMSLSTACSSSLVNIIMACRALQNNECRAAIAGGISVQLPQKKITPYNSGGVLSKDGVCRPFNVKGTGTVSANGAGVVVLKRLKDALEDQDHIYAVVRGFGVNNDGSAKVSYSAPSFLQQAACMRLALKSAKVSPQDVGYIEAHGTGTTIGDSIEIDALKRVYQQGHGQSCPIGALKSNIGHTDMAAGVAGVIKTALAISHNVIPPTVNYDENDAIPNLEESAFYVNTEPKKWAEKTAGRRRVGAINSLGIGGTNAHVILEEYSAPVLISLPDHDYIIPLSATSDAQLAALKKNLLAFLQTQQDTSLSIGNIAFTLSAGRMQRPVRESFLCRSIDELKAQLSTPELVKKSAESIEWEQGGNISWLKIFNRQFRKVSLPCLPLEKLEAWIEPSSVELSASDILKSSAKSFATQQWISIELEKISRLPNDKTWVLFADDDCRDSQHFIKELSQFGQEVIVFHHADSFEKLGPMRYKINLASESSCQYMLDNLPELANVNLDHVLYFPTAKASSKRNMVLIKNIFMYLTKCFSSSANTNFVIVDRHSVKLPKKGVTSEPDKALLHGLAIVLQQELHMSSALVDLGEDPSSVVPFAHDIIAKCAARTLPVLSAYHGRVCYKKELKRWSPSICEANLIAPKCSVVITGGLGRIGLSIAQEFAHCHNAHILLLAWNPSALQNTPYSLSDIRANLPEALLEKLQAIEHDASSLTICYTDITSSANLQEILPAFIEQSDNTKVDYLFHLAANLKLGAKHEFSDISEERVDSQYSPKVAGLRGILTAADEIEIGCGVVFSSISTLVGGHRMATYAGVNSVLDSLFHNSRKCENQRWFCLNWDAWGFDADSEDKITPAFGMGFLKQVLQSSDVGLQLFISSQDVVERSKASDSFVFLGNNKNINNEFMRADKLKSIITEAFKVCLGIAEVDENMDYYDYGGDSLLGVELADYLEKALSCSVKTVTTLQNRTINQLLDAIMTNCLSPSDSSIYLLEESDGPPIFFLHPVSGMNLCYANVAKRLSQHYRCYAIHDPEIDDGKPMFESLDDMASHYLNIIRRIQPEGDLTFVGYSFGGNVAHAMLKQLEQQGYKNNTCFIIDGWAIYSDDLKDFERFKSTIQKHVSQLIDKLSSKSTENSLVELLWHRMQLAFHHKIQKIEHDLVLLKAEKLLSEYKSISHSFNHWNKYTSGKVDVYKLNKAHDTILDSLASASIADIIHTQVSLKLTTTAG